MATGLRVALLWVLVALAGCTTPPAPPASGFSWPSPLPSEQEFDFGTVAQGTRLKHTFVLAHPEPVLGIDMSCDCMAATVAAGGLLTVEVDTSQLTGPFHRRASIRTRSGYRRVAVSGVVETTRRGKAANQGTHK